MKKFKFLFKTYIAGFSYYNGVKIFTKLAIGTELQMRREVDNKYDSRAIALYFDGEKIGFIPREDNVILSGFLDL